MTFQELLEMMEGGTTVEDLLRGVENAVKASQMAMGKKATVTLTMDIKVERAKRALIQPKIKLALPQPTRMGVVVFADDRGGLHKRDPDQAELFPDEVDQRRKLNEAKGGGDE